MAETQPPLQPAPLVQPHRAALVFVFGLLGVLSSVFGLGLVFGILAWVFGARDLKAMNQGRLDPSERSLTSAGRVLGIIGAVLGASWL